MIDPDDDPQDLVGGRFEIVRLLGTGGRATVYAARDSAGAGRLDSPQLVALKVLRPELDADPTEREALAREARMLGRVRHPGVSAALDSGPGWLALELLDGVTLAEMVAASGPLGMPQAVAVAEGVLDALTAVHAAGLVHRDVTPANILLVGGELRAGAVRLIDFGLAAPQGESAIAGAAQVMGSLHYMSPELLRGRPVGPGSDLYQLGAVLHLALTGRPPFVGDDVAAVMRAHATAPPPPPSLSGRHIDRRLDGLVVRALLKRPADRHPDAAAMRRALAEAVPRGTSTPDAGAEADSGATRLLPVLGEPATLLLPRAAGVGAGHALREPAPGYLRPASEETGSPSPAATDRALTESRVTRPATASRAGALLALAAIATVAILGAGYAIAGAGTGAAPVAEAVPTPAAPTPSATAPPPRAPAVAPVAGAQLVVIPALTTLSSADAVAALAAQGLQAGRVTTVDSARSGGTVLDSAPAAGSSVPAGSTVDLVLATGSNTVPTVTGQTVRAAEALLRAAGFVPRRVESGGDGAGAGGSSVDTATVQGVSPAQGRSAPVGSTVELRVSAPPEPEPAPGVDPAPAPTPTPPAAPTGRE